MTPHIVPSMSSTMRRWHWRRMGVSRQTLKQLRWRVVDDVFCLTGGFSVP
jgi:hypothetical protein